MDQPVMMRDNGYHLAEIWQYLVSDSGMQRPPFRSGLVQFGDTNREILGNDPVCLEQKPGQVSGRRRCEDDEAANKTATTSNGNGNVAIDGDGKRLKTSGGDEESNDSKAEAAEPGSGKPAGKKGQPAEPPKDYIHVRARRGQATDSHSLAKRARREKISERMKILQDLVPGCNKVIGKALVLDEIINYIQSLQHQVEFLSMKLEAVNTRMEIEIDVFPHKEVLVSPKETLQLG